MKEIIKRVETPLLISGSLFTIVYYLLEHPKGTILIFIAIIDLLFLGFFIYKAFKYRRIVFVEKIAKKRFTFCSIAKIVPFILFGIFLLKTNWNDVVVGLGIEQPIPTLGTPTATPSPIISTISEIFTPTVQVESPSPMPTNTLMPTEIPIPSLTPTPSPVLSPRGFLYCIILETPGVNVRINPNDQSKHLGNLSFDDCLYFSDVSSDGAWVRIALIQPEEYSSVAGGWVLSSYLTPSSFDGLPEYSRANDWPDDFLCVNVRSVKVREQPSTASSSYIKGIIFNECLKFDGKNEDGSWVRISLDEEKFSSYSHGWIRSDLLIPKWRINNLPIVTPDPTPQG